MHFLRPKIRFAVLILKVLNNRSAKIVMLLNKKTSLRVKFVCGLIISGAHCGATGVSARVSPRTADSRSRKHECRGQLRHSPNAVIARAVLSSIPSRTALQIQTIIYLVIIIKAYLLRTYILIC